MNAVATTPTVIQRYDVNLFLMAAPVFFVQASHVVFMNQLCRSSNLSLGDCFSHYLDLLTRPLASVRDLKYLAQNDNLRPCHFFFFDPCKAPPPCNLGLTQTVCVWAPSRRTHLSYPGVQRFLALARFPHRSSLSVTSHILYSLFSR